MASATGLGLGCGGVAPDDETWTADQPVFVGDTVPPEDLALDPLGPQVEQQQGALLDGSSIAPPHVVYLRYADGSALPRTPINPCPRTAPAFTCQFAGNVKDCQKEIQSYLDDWYKDFNVVFTLDRPTTGAFFTEVVSSGGGDWCQASSSVAGIAPFYCDNLEGGVAYTFLGGRSAKETAIIVAQEQAHLVGLEHTDSRGDVMYPTLCPDCDGFQDVANKVRDDHCDRPTQNSYQLMLERLGPWPGGQKPTPFGCEDDTIPPTLTVMEPAANAMVPSTFVVRARATDACAVTKVAIKVSPAGLSAETKAEPFEWTLTNMKGKQTVTLTATDKGGRTTTSTVTVTISGTTAPGTGGAPGAGGAGGASMNTGGTAGTAAVGERDPATIPGGCQLAACDVGRDGARGGDDGALATWFLAALGLLVSRRRRGRA